MKFLSTAVLVTVLMTLPGCSAYRAKPVDDLGLERFDLTGMKEREDFIAMVSDLVEGQEACKFTAELLARITTGSSLPGAQWIPERDSCIGQVKVAKIDFVDWAASIWIETSSQMPARHYHIHALLEKNQWLFYWPEPIDIEHPFVQ